MPYLLRNLRKPSASQKKRDRSLLLMTTLFALALSCLNVAWPIFFVSLPVCLFSLLFFFILDELYKLNFFFLCI